MGGILSNKVKIILLVGLFVYIMLDIFGMIHLKGCLFMGKAMICRMDILEHIALWQYLFAVIPQEVFILLTLLSLLTFIVLIKSPLNIIYKPNSYSSQKIYTSKQIELPVFNFLKRAFSQGILHPKIYLSL